MFSRLRNFHYFKRFYFSKYKTRLNIPKFVKQLPTCESAAVRNSWLLLSSPILISCTEQVKQPCTLIVNATISLLESTMTGLEETSSSYELALLKIISLYQDYLVLQSSNEELWDKVIETRVIIDEAKANYEFYLIYMNSVDKIVKATIEVALSIEADDLCLRLIQIQRDTLERISQIENEIKQLKSKYLEVQRQMTLISK